MVDADQRRRLCEPVSLNHRVTEPPPEFFGVCIEGRAAADECPEFPAELAVNVTKHPPPAQKMFAFGVP